MHTHIFVRITHGIINPWYVIIIPMYNEYPYFSFTNWGKKVRVMHGKAQHSLISAPQMALARGWGGPTAVFGARCIPGLLLPSAEGGDRCLLMSL